MPNDDPSRADTAALQGAWTQLAVEANGAPDPHDAHTAPGARTHFEADRFEVRTASGVVLLAGTFALDATHAPKRVDWSDTIGPDAGKILPAIYRLDGDRFVFIAADAGQPRPTEFRTKQGQTMRSFVRFHPVAP